MSKPIHRWRAFSLLAVAAFMTIMDLTIVNTALPTIGRKLHFSQTSLLWVVTAYGLAYGGFLLLGGRAADLLGTAAHDHGRPRAVHGRFTWEPRSPIVRAS